MTKTREKLGRARGGEQGRVVGSSVLHELSRLGRRCTARDMSLHLLRPPQVVGRIEAIALRRARRSQQAITPLPCAQHVGAGAAAAAEFPDAEIARVLVHVLSF